MLLSLMLRLLLVDEVETLRLDQPVDGDTRESGKDFLGFLMRGGLAVLCAMVLICFGSYAAAPETTSWVTLALCSWGLVICS